ncbi:nickel pincer cofactor biosynthesis protein LarC [Pelotomaculum isophthalicicum JI]|uniref:Pyridinium-3,5-bisthiocarboxylic acid mononucleotide nickel insertion protein n=1 Tax=Pelotomaculum isophthalicicum JI TaxID=947010 RepID=A0A9X4H7D3_9FIRM|nr:nickel pincer cofactor biosynthesis protein LarC [Pelotomaculum isophthalicicum]MDF9407669.1 nickel pincer cofactor biosynthesis protein LarC [Pelotomaculum isophthalicicum JI]
MKVLYFDCFSGISGDMTLGALIDLGIDVKLFKDELQKLNLTGYEITIQKKVKHGIAGTDVEINTYDDHAHKARNLRDIEMLIESSGLSENVKCFSGKVFLEIARAEAKVHNMSIDEVHFHEVGAVDSIVDIVGASICLDLLGAQKVFSSPLHEGQGFIECRHGRLPVPVPAVMEMLAGSKIPIPIISENINTELVTPTGMGIIKCLASGFGNMPAMIINKVGYGMGKRETGRLNAIRIVMGTFFEDTGDMEEVVVLETNIDDMSPEIIGYMAERLLASGALDVFHTPIYMKKNRPAAMVTVLARKEDEQKLADIVLKESSTLGIRRSIVARYRMDREIINVNTNLGAVRVKVASKGNIKKIAPEYEDCKEIAIRAGLPLQEVLQMVLKKSKEQLV